MFVRHLKFKDERGKFSVLNVPVHHVSSCSQTSWEEREVRRMRSGVPMRTQSQLARSGVFLAEWTSEDTILC